MRRTRELLLGLCLALSALPVPAAQQLVLCYEDKESFPWVMAEGQGLNLTLLRAVGEALELDLRFVPVPWRRCLNGLGKGIYDGAFAASYLAERQAYGVYPLDADGRVDEDKRLHAQAYLLYSRKDDPVGWNGNQFRQLRGVVGTLSGFSIVDFLKAHGAEVLESSRDPEALLYMLASRRIQAVAMQSLRAEHVLQRRPELAAVIRPASLPLETKAYYLMLSHQLLEARPQLASRIWQEIQRQRESPAYRQAVEALGR